MKKMNVAEMRNVNAGAKYTEKCRYCGKKFSATWFWFLVSKKSAMTTVGLKRRSHENNCMYSYYL